MRNTDATFNQIWVSLKFQLSLIPSLDPLIIDSIMNAIGYKILNMDIQVREDKRRIDFILWTISWVAVMTDKK